MPRSVRGSLFLVVLSAALSACGTGGSGTDAGAGAGGGGGGTSGVGGGFGGGFGGGAGGGGGSTGDDGGLSASNYCARYASVFCSRQTQCGPMRLSNLNDCFNELSRSCEISFGQAVRASGLELDLAGAQRCLTELQTAHCDLVPVMQNAFCNGLYKPGAQVGETCSNSYCVGSWCKLDGGQAGCGSCEPHLPIGASCTATQQCDPDAGTCVASALTGIATCTVWREDGQSCPNASRCRSGLCPNRADGGNWCGALGTGEACSSHASCGADAYCRGLSPLQNGTCRKRLALGSNCQDEWTDDGCLGVDATCLDNVCTTPKVASRTEGQSCDEATQCGAELYCSGLRGSATRKGVCARKLTADAGCVNAFPSECALGLVCAGQRCVNYKNPGEGCSSTAECGPYSRCLALAGTNNPVCVSYVSPGQQCPTSSMCLGGYCERNPDGSSGACTQLKQDGESCLSTNECLSSRCYRTSSSAANNVCSPGCFQ